MYGGVYIKVGKRKKEDIRGYLNVWKILKKKRMKIVNMIWMKEMMMCQMKKEREIFKRMYHCT